MRELVEFSADFKAFTGSEFSDSRIRNLYRIIIEPGLWATLIFRLQSYADRVGRSTLSRWLFVLNYSLTGAEIGPGTKIGKGVTIRHPNGIVIGGGTMIGSNCIILARVTIGERYPNRKGNGRKYAIVGDECMLGTAATILGTIEIGNMVNVGAHSLVLESVGDGQTVVGSPAQVVLRRERPGTGAEENNSHTHLKAK